LKLQAKGGRPTIVCSGDVSSTRQHYYWQASEDEQKKFTNESANERILKIS